MDMEDRVKALASEALSHFEVRERSSGEKFVGVKVGAPVWVSHLVRHAHDGMLPDDWRYEFIGNSLTAIAHGDLEGVSLVPSDYTYQLANWLASDGYRISYCDDALLDACTATTFSLLQAGQLLEIREVHSLTREFLEELALDDEHASTLSDFYGVAHD